MSATERLREIEAFLHEKIPLTRAMGVRVEAWDESGLVLGAPLELNHNHLGTAFGGSLGALATLAGYGVMWLALGDEQAHVVIRDSAIRFRHPVKGDLRAVCGRPEAAVMEGFKGEFARRGKARMKLRVSITQGEQEAVEFEGTFVAVR